MSATGSRPASRSTASEAPRGLDHLAWAAAMTVAATLAFVVWVAQNLWRMAPAAGAWHLVLTAFAVCGVAATLGLLVPLGNALRIRGLVSRSREAGDVLSVRKYAARFRTAAWMAVVSSFATLCVALFVLFLMANNHAVQHTFFNPAMIGRSWIDVTKAFTKNVIIATLSEVIVLVFGLLLALVRLAPGKAGRPISMVATAYIDIFRAVPAIIVIYLVGFGVPLAHIPLLSSMDSMEFAILALSLTYSAYVAEVYRAGIQSVHASQVAAARSLGFSHIATMRYVVVPQAVRRVIPPLLNDFIGLQKDTALVMVIGTVDAFNQAKIYASNYFNLSSVTVVAALFILITIPQTRFVDQLIARDQRRLQGAG